MIGRMIEKYAKFVSHRAGLTLAILLFVTLIALIGAATVGEKSQDNRDILPDDIAVIQAFDVIEASFGGSDSVMIAVEIDPQVAGSDEVRDVRDPRVIEYLYQLSVLAAHTDDVTDATSAGTLLRQMNGGVLPQTQSEINRMIDSNPRFSSYISPDNSLAVIRISLADQYDAEELANDLQALVDGTPEPPGVAVGPAGAILEDPVIMQQIGPDMQKTSRFAMIGISIVLLLLFMSIRYAVTPLLVIIVGIIWAFGYLGFMGTDLSPTTSGAISMIMGIGIDFGIQTISRFRQELKNAKPEMAMQITLTQVFMPMATTTLAALIGFKAMSMGELTVLAELATIMGYGVAACFLAAITIVPVVGVLGEKAMIKFRGGNRK